ncbi:MAG: hypothetical protein ACRCVT_02760 [Leadbetterella sp.]
MSFKNMLFLSVLVVSSLGLYSCNSKASQPVSSIDEESEKKAIFEAVKQESKDFYSKNFDVWAKNYVHSPKLFWVCVEPDVTLRANGWDDLAQFVKGWMKENPNPVDYEKSNFKLDNVEISLNGDHAFISHNGSNLLEDGKSTRFTTECRTMVKEDGKWKIFAMTSYPQNTPDNGSTSNVYVHQAVK